MHYLYKSLFGLLVSVPLIVNAGDWNSALGGGIGGALGAAIGSEIGDRNGAILGSALGAAVGTAIATHRRPHYYRTTDNYAQPPYNANYGQAPQGYGQVPQGYHPPVSQQDNQYRNEYKDGYQKRPSYQKQTKYRFRLKR